MSEVSYQEKVRLKIASPEKGVCEQAAIGRIHPTLDVSTPTYLAKISYELRAEEGFPNHHTRNALMSELYEMTARDLGLDNRFDVGFEHVSTVHELALLLRHLIVRDQLVVIDVDAPFDHDGDPADEVVTYDPQLNAHSVGLVPLSIGANLLFEGRSTWLPSNLQGSLTPEDLFENMMYYSDRYLDVYRFNDANVTFYPLYVPPERPADNAPGKLKRILDTHRKGKKLTAQVLTKEERRYFKNLESKNTDPKPTLDSPKAPPIPSRSLLR